MWAMNEQNEKKAILCSDMQSNSQPLLVYPKQNQSGKSVGSTTISKVGNPRLRKAFYMASLTAKRFNPNLQDFVTRLAKNGKAPKAIVCAVMRKLAHLVYSVLKNNRTFIIRY